MKTTLFTALLCCFAPLAFGQPLDCSTIRPDKQRLMCYDKESASKKAEAAAATTIAVATTTQNTANSPKTAKQFRSHEWVVDESVDAMTDKKTCTALYKNQWTIQGTAKDLYISLKGRGGVSAYKLRFNDDPPMSLQLATSIEKSLSAVDLGPNFQQAYEGTRLRVQVSTVLNSLIVEDIDLSGFKDAVDYIRAQCGA